MRFNLPLLCWFIGLSLASYAAADKLGALSIRQAIQETLATNYDIQVARVSQDIAKTNKDTALSDLLPDISYTSTYINNSNIINPFLIQEGFQISYTFLEALSFTVSPQYNDELIALSELQLRQTIETTVSNTLQAFYDVAIAEAQYNLAVANTNYARSALAQTQVQATLGSASQDSLTTAKLTLNTREQSERLAKNTLDTQRHTLNQLVGRPLYSVYPLDITDELPTLPKSEAIIAVGLYNNTNIALSKQNQTIADYDKKLLVASLYPNVSYNYQMDRDATPFSTLQFSWQAIPTFQRSRLNAADQQIAMQALNYDSVVLSVKTQLVQTVSDYNLYQDLVAQATAAETLARSNLARKTALYQTGQLAALDYQDAQLTFLTNQVDLQEKQLTLNKLKTRLLQLMSLIL